MHVAIQAVLSLYASGRKTGFVMDFGDGVSHIMPIFEGCALPHAILHWVLACRDLSEILMKILTSEKLCNNVRLYWTQSSNRPRKLPTRIRPTCSQTKTSSLSARNVSITRVLFQPYFTGTQASGIHNISFRSAESYINVVLSNDKTMFQRIVERMTKKLVVWLHPR